MEATFTVNLVAWIAIMGFILNQLRLYVKQKNDFVKFKTITEQKFISIDNDITETKKDIEMLRADIEESKKERLKDYKEFKNDLSDLKDSFFKTLDEKFQLLLDRIK